jgi:hypothetical protein
MRPNLRRSQNQAGVQVGHAVTRVPHPFQRLAQKYHRIRAFPLRVRRWKQRPNIRRRNRPQQRISDGMQQNITIGMPTQPPIMRDRDPANPQRNPGKKLMRIKPIPNSQKRPLTRRGFTRIDANFSLFHPHKPTHKLAANGAADALVREDTLIILPVSTRRRKSSANKFWTAEICKRIFRPLSSRNSKVGTNRFSRLCTGEPASCKP